MYSFNNCNDADVLLDNERLISNDITRCGKRF